MKYSLRDRKGFTLVELLTVVAIIGVLAAIAVPAYRYVIDQAKRTSGIAALDTVRKEMEVYLIDKGQYPASIDFTDFTDQDGNRILLNWNRIKDKLYVWGPYTPAPSGSYTFQVQAHDSNHTTLTLTPQGITH